MIEQIRSCPTTSLTSLFKKKNKFSAIFILYMYCTLCVGKKRQNNRTLDKQEINLWFVVYLMHYKAKAMKTLIINKLEEAFCKASCCTNKQVFFILGEDDGLLVLVDQHAAHERVRLEHLQSGRSKSLLCFNCFFAFLYCLVLID